MCRILLDRWQWTLDRKKVDEALIVAAPPGKSNKSWFVNRLGMHFTVVSAPVDFWMGGKQDKNSPYDFNPKRFERIDRSYAIAMDHADFSILTQFKPDFQSHRFSWNQGLDFCRWLNQNEQYSDIDLSVFSEPDGMDQLGNYVGYRLPTSEEWEFAAKGYASTICHFGTTKTAHYSSFRRSDEDQAIPFPNRLGLTGLGDYAEPTNTLFPINPKMVLLRGSRISSSLAGRSETEATPSSRDGISSTFRLRVVLVLPNY